MKRSKVAFDFETEVLMKIANLDAPEKHRVVVVDADSRLLRDLGVNSLRGLLVTPPRQDLALSMETLMSGPLVLKEPILSPLEAVLPPEPLRYKTILALVAVARQKGLLG